MHVPTNINYLIDCKTEYDLITRESEISIRGSWFFDNVTG